MSEGLDFTGMEDEIRAEWEEWENDERKWDVLSEQAAADMFRTASENASYLASDLNQIEEDNAFKDVEEAIKEFCKVDVGEGSEIYKFKFANGDSFPNVAPTNQKASFYPGLEPNKKIKYDKMHDYYQDAMWYGNVAKEIRILLMELPLELGFKILRTELTMKDEKYDKALYDKINADFRSFSNMIGEGMYDLERRAKLSEKFYEENKNKLKKDKLNQLYRKERLKDYVNEVKQCTFVDSLENFSNGRFECKSSVYAKMHIIDNYTYEISRWKDQNVESRMQESIEYCKTIDTKYIDAAIKTMMTPAGRGSMSGLHDLVEEVQYFCDRALDAYKRFRNGDDNGPYCFMKALPASKSYNHKYRFEPEQDDPWNLGTFMINIYSMGRSALNLQCEDFVQNNGHLELK